MWQHRRLDWPLVGDPISGHNGLLIGLLCLRCQFVRTPVVSPSLLGLLNDHRLTLD